jgi:hypothetical protein
VVVLREFAMEISETSFGSSHTLPFPHLSTLAASRFWSFKDTMVSAGEEGLPTGCVCGGAEVGGRGNGGRGEGYIPRGLGFP